MKLELKGSALAGSQLSNEALYTSSVDALGVAVGHLRYERFAFRGLFDV